MKILGQEIPFNKKTVIELEVAKLHTGTSISIPIVVYRAKKKGPTLLLISGIHGDELNGIEIIRRINAKKLYKVESGTLITIPVINAFGFLNLSRSFPDGKDLNRMFPGSLKGSLASRLAYRITNEILPSVDYAIDFHTGGAQRSNHPQIRCVFKDKRALELAKVFNTKFIIDSPFRNSSFRKTAHEMKKCMLLFEGGKSLMLKPNAVKDGFSGTLKVMKHLGMIANLPDDLELKKNESILLNDSKWVRASNSGMFISFTINGSYVEKGKTIGQISDPYGFVERKVKAPISGYVFCVNTAPVVNKGDALFNIGFEKSKP